MAAKKEVKDEQKGGIGKAIVAIVVLLLIMLITFILLVKLDVFGLGTKVLGPKLQNVPVLNLILPEMPEDVGNTITEPYSFKSIEQAVESLKASDNLLKEKTKEAEKLSEDLAKLLAEIERLKIFEANQVQFEEDQKEIAQLIADNADPIEFMKYVENLYPDQALAIYEELVKQKGYDEEVLALAKIYQEMEAESAAPILEQTASSNLEMVKEIILNLDATQAGAILGAMDPAVADRISKYIYPDNPN